MIPETVYPIIAHLADIRIEEAVYFGYLRPLTNHLGMYRDGFWRAPNWLHIEDSETVAAVAEAGLLDLKVFLRDKPPEARTDAALAVAFPGKWTVPPDVLMERFSDLAEGASSDLFGHGSGSR